MRTLDLIKDLVLRRRIQVGSRAYPATYSMRIRVLSYRITKMTIHVKYRTYELVNFPFPSISHVLLSGTDFVLPFILIQYYACCKREFELGIDNSGWGLSWFYKTSPYKCWASKTSLSPHLDRLCDVFSIRSTVSPCPAWKLYAPTQDTAMPMKK
jgi:hypothetical protein